MHQHQHCCDIFVTKEVRNIKRNRGPTKAIHFPKELDNEKLQFIDEALAANDELTARQLLLMLQDHWPCFNASLSTIKRARMDDLGWVKSRPKYCQLILTATKEKKLKWCQKRISERKTFDNLIWSDSHLLS